MSLPGSGAGAGIVAEACKRMGIKYCFGVVGIPIFELGAALQNAGLIYIGMRNEQAASYAAGAVGYLTGTPGLCICVSGPGVVHSLAGLANAKENGWPMILIGGASDSSLDSMMSFQESPQVEYARPYVKYAARFDSIERALFYVERAFRISMAGRPGPVYLDYPGDFANKNVDESKIVFPVSRGPPVASIADPAEIEKACAALVQSKTPLIIIGKGMQIAKAEKEVLALVNETGYPFIPSPMGKGLVPDSHSQNVIAARSTALEKADVVILLGSRLNWINHFGLPPRFRADVKLVQVDILPEAFGDNVPNTTSLLGHAPLVVDQLRKALIKTKGFKTLSGGEEWWKTLAAKVEKNASAAEALAKDASVPMNYYHPITLVQTLLEKEFPDSFIVSEGANTMDIGRTILENELPRRRLDAATYGSMGPAMGQAIAAQLVYPTSKIVCLLGDSSFGFSAMEIETMCRYRMPIVIIIINNSGIAVGIPFDNSATTLEERTADVPTTSLLGSENARYEMMATAFGGLGLFVTEPAQVQPAVRKAMANPMPTIINICINPMAGRRAQSHDWLSRSTEAKL